MSLTVNLKSVVDVGICLSLPSRGEMTYHILKGRDATFRNNLVLRFDFDNLGVESENSTPATIIVDDSIVANLSDD